MDRLMSSQSPRFISWYHFTHMLLPPLMYPSCKTHAELQTDTKFHYICKKYISFFSKSIYCFRTRKEHSRRSSRGDRRVARAPGVSSSHEAMQRPHYKSTSEDAHEKNQTKTKQNNGFCSERKCCQYSEHKCCHNRETEEEKEETRQANV